jgi:hypothetical protein
VLSDYSASEREETITANVYIKIQNNSDYSLLLTHTNNEESPVGSSSPIVMPDESAYYITNASDVSSYQFMKNTSVPIAFPADVSAFIAGHLYSFMYDGTNLTLLANRALSIDSALADVLSFPTGITAQALSGSSIHIFWNTVSEASGYNVYRSSSEEGMYTKTNEVIIIENSYIDTELTRGVTYYYKVVSVDANGRESQKSEPVNETTLTQTIGNISYSPVTGSAWALQSDGRYKSPAIGSNGITKMRVSFTTVEANVGLTINLDVSSEFNYDYAFVGNLDSSSATSANNYYDRISGATSKEITITIPNSGSHFIEIGYGKDGSGTAGSDCAWFRIE